MHSFCSLQQCEINLYFLFDLPFPIVVLINQLGTQNHYGDCCLIYYLFTGVRCILLFYVGRAAQILASVSVQANISILTVSKSIKYVYITRKYNAVIALYVLLECLKWISKLFKLSNKAYPYSIDRPSLVSKTEAIA